MAKFRPNLGQFWPKWVIFEFSPKKRNRHVFSTPETRLRAKKLGNSNAWFSKKMWKTTIFGHFGQIWVNFGQNGLKRGHFRIFGGKVKTSPSYSYFSKQKIRKFQCAVSEKIWRMETRYIETDRDEGKFIGPNPPGGRRTKKLARILD